jgi:helix-turn-helix protein
MRFAGSSLRWRNRYPPWPGTLRGMDYAEARTAFFQPRDAGAPQAGTSGWRSPARTLRDALEPIATVCFWSEPAYDAYAAQGLDFLQGYVWARGSVLGEPEGTVVAAAFGVFEPGLIAALYDAGRAVCGLVDVRAAKEAGAVTALREVLGGSPDGLDVAVEALRRGAAAADCTGRPLHAGLLALPWPDEPLGRLWHAATILREHRGDSHLATSVAHGLTGLEANLLTELWVGWAPHAYAGSRAWSPEAMDAATAVLTTRGLIADGALTAEGRALREGIEETTDRLVQPVVDAIGDDLPGVLKFLDGWSQQIVERGWFPPDPYKRASG